MNVSNLILRESSSFLFSFSFHRWIRRLSLFHDVAISNIYTRRVLAGEFQIVNPWLLRDLVERGLWNDAMKNTIIAHNGSIQNGAFIFSIFPSLPHVHSNGLIKNIFFLVSGIPAEFKAIYKTVWEISQKTIIDLSADRGAFIDQSQSLNIHLASPTMAQLTSMHFYGWKKGLKTGMVRFLSPFISFLQRPSY